MISEQPIASQPHSDTAPPLRIWLLGTFRVNVQGVDIANFRSNKSRALLSYLLLTESQPSLRSDLDTLFWPDYLAKSARSNLRQALSNLRDLLAPFDLIAADYTHIYLKRDPTIIWCDAWHFADLLDSCQRHPHRSLADCAACRARLQAAVALYGGGLLENFPAIDSEPFHTWLQGQRAHFAAGFAEAQVALAKPSALPGNLRPALTPLIGRGHERQTLEQKLRDPVYRCVSLVGPGGVGKTRLACAVGSQVQANFPDGVWLVEAGALTPTTLNETAAQGETAAQVADRLSTAIGVALGYAFQPPLRPTEQLANYLAAHQALLILDSFEHISAAAAWLPTLLLAAPQLRLLITTRHRLPIQSQLLVHIEGLVTPPAVLPAVLSTTLSADQFIAQYTSVQLFVERAASTQPQVIIDTPTLATIARLCSFVNGSPWAIELAVALLDQQSPAAILAAIQHHYGALTTDLVDLPLRQRSAKAVFQTSWQLLAPHEAQTLARCALFQGGFTFNAAQAIAEATAADLAALVHKSLLHLDPPLDTPLDHPARYTIHDLVRHFAREQLAQHPDLARESQARHAAYYLTLVAGWQPMEAAEARFRTAVQADLGNVETAWAWALAQNQYPLLLAAVEGLAEFYQMTGAFHVAEALFAESITQVRAYLSKAAQSERPSTSPRRGATSAGDASCSECTAQQFLATLLLYQSDVCVGLAQLVQAQAAAAEALTLVEPLGVAKLLVRSYYALAVVALSQSQFERTQTLCKKAIEIARPQGLWREEAFCLGIASVADSDHQTRVTGLQYQMQALALAEAHQDTRQALRFRTFLGAAYRDLGNFSASLHCFEQNLVLLRRREDRYNVALTTINLGALLLLLGDYDAAANALAEGSAQLRLLRQNRLLAQCLALLGALRLAQGNYTAAAAACRQALDQPHIILMAQQIAWLTLGDLHGAQGALSAAQSAYQQVIALTPEPNAPARLMAHAGLATLRLVREDAAALTALEALLPAFDPERFDIIFTAQRFLLAAYQILAANQDVRAAGILQQAWHLVTTSAARISDPRLRQSYLTQVSVHRTIGQLIDAQREENR